ncbi:Polysaccharide biosynthesis protein [Actinomyces bovis]|uniref:Polysaccharide biosynthesis protein n=1 Tax=Actinomyces bovis TaxID=1658 RepID=A0ABY1VM13_9ACTO|nr:oligosaccharide flippase family protein [Actinomyces bovis]SPT53130.1 Polysaccharide biosynthesis protein [Actinomyces bovis]VEG52282.1 Polysaccharide biosynthesis protein [Actinomyces israelii]
MSSKAKGVLRGSGMWQVVGRTAFAKIAVMGVAGVFGLINTRLIIGHFGADAYAQYGLLATFPNLIPFADLGIGAVVINAVSSSDELSSDSQLRRTLTTAMRVLLGSALVIASIGIVIGLLGLWPTLLGAKVMPGGGITATLCLLVYAAALPLTIGQRVVVGMGRAATQVLSQGIVSPAFSTMLVLAIVLRLDAGNELSIMSYLANSLVAIICVIVAWRATRPLLREAAQDVLRFRTVPGVPIAGTAAPQFIQTLAIPLAFQTDRLLLSHFGGSQDLAQYTLAASLFQLLTQTLFTTANAMWPQFAKARAQGRVVSPFKPTLVFAIGGLLAALAMAALTPWAANKLSKGLIAIPAVLIASWVLNVVVEAAKQPITMYMTSPQGLQFQMWPVFVLIPANLALSYLLIAPLGAAGPLLGSALTILFCQLLPYGWWVRRDLRRRRAQAAA